MLDQLTDRFWFMVGAIMVGALVISSACNLFPFVFNKVADKLDDTIESVVIPTYTPSTFSSSSGYSVEFPDAA